MERALLDEIVRACLEDERLLKIVKDIAGMNDEERREFREKVVRFFMDKADEVDVQAYRFFRIVTEDGNAETILREVYEVEKDRG